MHIIRTYNSKTKNVQKLVGLLHNVDRLRALIPYYWNQLTVVDYSKCLWRGEQRNDFWTSLRLSDNCSTFYRVSDVNWAYTGSLVEATVGRVILQNCTRVHNIELNWSAVINWRVKTGQRTATVASWDDTIRYDTIRYDAICYFNVRSKADMSQLNLPHGDDN